MRYAKQGGRGRPIRLTYSCTVGFCTALDLYALEAFVVAVVLERLARPDAREQIGRSKLAPDVEAAVAEAAMLRQRLADATDQFTAGRLSAATLARVEGDLLPKIGSAERRTRVAGLPSVAAEIAANNDPSALWDERLPEQRREVIRALLDVVVLPVKVRRRKGFDPSTVRMSGADERRSDVHTVGTIERRRTSSLRRVGLRWADRLAPIEK
jgi:hypothetical protein